MPAREPLFSLRVGGHCFRNTKRTLPRQADAGSKGVKIRIVEMRVAYRKMDAAIYSRATATTTPLRRDGLLSPTVNSYTSPTDHDLSIYRSSRESSSSPAVVRGLCMTYLHSTDPTQDNCFAEIMNAPHPEK